MIIILLIFCVGEIYAQQVWNLKTGSSLRKSLKDTSSIYILNGEAPSAVITDKKDIFCVGASWSAESHSIAARIDSNGNFLWNNVQLSIPQNPLDVDLNAYILPRSAGGVYFAFDYWEYRGTVDQLEIYAFYPHIQYVDASGKVKWGPTGKRLTSMVVDYQNGASIQHINFATDGDIMVYWNWVGASSGNQYDYGTFVQKVDPTSGEFKFETTGKRLLNFRASPLIQSPNGYIYIKAAVIR